MDIEKTDFTGKLSEVLAFMQEKEEMRRIFSPDKEELVFDIAIHRKNRSIKANAYAWALCTKIADKLNSSKDEIYLKLLQRYGQSFEVNVSEDVPEEKIAETMKYYEKIGQRNGSRIYRVYKGTSEYDSREMSVFIDGIISEAKEIGVPVLSEEEVENIKKEWD